MRFVFVLFLFLFDYFDLSVSTATRKRADQPIRPSACARQCPERHIEPLPGVFANRTLVVLLCATNLPISRQECDAARCQNLANRSNCVSVQRQRRCLMLAWGIAP